MLQQIAEVQGRHMNRAVECLLHNATFTDLPVYSVLKCRGSALPADQAKDFNLSKNFVLRGERPGCNESRVAILQQPAEQGQIVKAIYAGVTPVLITGDRGKGFATTRSGLTTLVTADSGPFEVLYDFGDVLNSNEERYAVVRFGSAGGGADIVLFEITGFAYGQECEACNATVIMEGCNTNAGDSIEVSDEAGCFFDVPEEILEGQRGFAVRMKDPSGYEGCKWVVMSMCCTED